MYFQQTEQVLHLTDVVGQDLSTGCMLVLIGSSCEIQLCMEEQQDVILLCSVVIRGLVYVHERQSPRHGHKHHEQQQLGVVTVVRLS